MREVWAAFTTSAGLRGWLAPHAEISIKVAKPPANFPFPNAVREMWTVLYFSPAGSGRTNVREVTQLQRHFAGKSQ